MGSSISGCRAAGRQQDGEHTEKQKRGRRAGPPPMKPGVDYLNPGDEEQMEIYGYCHEVWKEIITWIFIVVTLGLLRLVFHWKPEWMLYCTHSTCGLDCAQKVVLKDQFDQVFVEVVNVHQAADISMIDVSQDGHNDNMNNSGKDLNGELMAARSYHELQQIRYFINKKIKYLYCPLSRQFEKMRALEENTPCSYFHHCTGISKDEQALRRNLYGENAIIVLVQPILKLLFLEVLNPFYVFQVYSVILWCYQLYYYFSSLILLLSIVSISLTVRLTRQMQFALRKTVGSTDVVRVYRGKGEEDIEEIPSEDLVPGDVIQIPSRGCLMQCDAVLIFGSCIVNESMLTGESLPVTKTPILGKTEKSSDDVTYHSKTHGRHTLFCGTKVLQTKSFGNESVKAVILSTGFATAKGELVRSIMFPKPVDFKFNRDTYKFICFLAMLAGLGFIYTIIILESHGKGAGYIAVRALDLITITIPPALPAAMTIGIIYAQRRLKKKLIYCISPRTINVSGAINAVCFDKTGTLTEDGIDMHGVVPVEQSRFQDAVTDMRRLTIGPFLTAMATCHSLTFLDGEMIGDPLDIKMFLSTGWSIEEPQNQEDTKFDMYVPVIVRPRIYIDKEDNEYVSNNHYTGRQEALKEDGYHHVGIVKQFTFTSSLQRMSVICKSLNCENLQVYVKGSPEMISSLSIGDTVPVDFANILSSYTHLGYRVLALGYKNLSPEETGSFQKLSREDVEKDLVFLGLLIMENKLKPETTPVIKQLRSANIRTIMVTGDNMLTALAVARHCAVIGKHERVLMANDVKQGSYSKDQVTWRIDNAAEPSLEFDNQVSKVTDRDAFITMDTNHYHLALTGATFEYLRKNFPEEMPKVVTRGTIFARMSPDQKGQLIEMLQDIGYYVGMCGDGANDCGALKAAHAGISLSDAEASVASPFTSKNANIECVPTLIREGRCALVTSFGMFRYQALYSLTQFISVMILYWIAGSLTDFEYLYIDLFEMTILTVFFGGTGAAEVLSATPPPHSLMNFVTIFSVFLQLSIIIAAQAFIFVFVKQQEWYVPFVHDEDGQIWNYEGHANAAVFTVSTFQYIVLCLVFAKGKPHRKPVYTNIPFIVTAAVILVVCIFIALYPIEAFADFLDYKIHGTDEFRGIMVAVGAISWVLAIFAEKVIVDWVLTDKCHNWRPVHGKRVEYEFLEEELSQNPQWPMLSSSNSNKDCYNYRDKPSTKDEKSEREANAIEESDIKILPSNEYEMRRVGKHGHSDDAL